LGDALGFETHVVPEIRMDGKAVSATRIRMMLAQGNIAQARKMLGRPYRLQVEVTNRVDTICKLSCVDHGKQELNEGRYRALLGCERHEIPVVVTVNGKGAMICALPSAVELGNELSMRFIAEDVR